MNNNPYLTKIQEIKKELKEMISWENLQDARGKLQRYSSEYDEFVKRKLVLQAKLQTAVKFLQMTRDTLVGKRAGYAFAGEIDLDEIDTVIVSEEITNINSALKASQEDFHSSANEQTKEAGEEK
jgi:ribosomal protein S20